MMKRGEKDTGQDHAVLNGGELSDVWPADRENTAGSRAVGELELEDSYALSPMQEGMLFHTLYASQSETYIRQIIFDLREALRIDLLKQAWSRIIERHPILRSNVRWADVAQPIQNVYRRVDLPFTQQDWSHLSTAEQQANLEVFIHTDRHQGIELTKAPLMRLILIRMSEADYRLIWTFHHILSDYFSDVLLMKEVFREYDALIRGERTELGQALSYKEHCLELGRQNLAKAELYWREKLQSVIDSGSLAISMAPQRAVKVGESRGEQEICLSKALTAELKTFAQQNGLTLNTLMQGAWALLLGRYSREQEVVFGGVRNCRRSALGGKGAAEIVGPFINMLPLRVRMPANQLSLPWLKEIRNQWVEMRDYEHTPLIKIQSWSAASPGTPLFNTVLIFEKSQMNTAVRAEGEEAWRKRSIRSIRARSNYALILIGCGEDQFLLSTHYDRFRFDDAAIAQMLSHLKHLLEGLITRPAQRLAEIRLMTPAERDQMLMELNVTKIDFASRFYLHQLFEGQVASRPNAVAIEFEEMSLSYLELNRRVNQLAHYLRRWGVGPEVLVGLCAERSVEMMVGTLGILKAGGAYMPLDPKYPAERLRYMLMNGAPRVLLTEERWLGELPEFDGATVCLDRDWPLMMSQSEENPPLEVRSENLAYVIYTSGSTGRPKGVAIDHGNAVNFINWSRAAFADEVFERMLFSTSLNFDLAVYECFVPLTVGGTVRIVGDALDLARLPVEVTLINTVPSTMTALVEMGRVPKSVRHVNLAGEPLKRELVERIFETTEAERVCNLYGPTETTTYSTWVEMRREEGFASHIGRPIANTQVYILDDQGEPAPIGVAGELYIGGAGVARGYLHHPELSAERFVPCPFAAEPGARMYRTGDLARYLSDGNLEFLGRLDHQVKIRGYRIELGEVENALRNHPDVRDAVVVTGPGPDGNKRLIGYVVSEQQLNLVMTTDKLRQWLQAKLPHYMIPSVFVLLEALPLTANGKLDRHALPAPNGQPEKVSYLAPRTPMEEALAGIWSEVLRVERVGVHDNFFDLGGHSLIATIMIARIRSELGVEMPLRSIFEAPTLAAFEEAIRTGEKAEAPPLVKASRAEKLPLSFAQRRLWLADQLMPNNHPFYNILRAVKLEGRLDVKALEWAINEIIRRHEVLRTRIEVEAGEPVQVIEDWEPRRLKVEDLTSLTPAEKEREIGRMISEAAAARFDLSKGPMLRAKVLELGEEQRILLITMHHIVTDGWSMGIMIRELGALYSACHAGERSPLEELEIQYADYAVWQRKWLQGEALKRQLSYWKRQLEGAPAVLELPTDRPRPPIQSFRGESQSLVLSAELTERLKELGRCQNATLFMTLLAGFQTLLYRYSWQEDIVVGAGIANRSRPETENLIGFFVNMLALRTTLSGNPSFTELLARVREVALGAYAHQDVPFDLVVDELQPKRDLGHTPLFQVVFTLQNAPSSALELPGVRLAPLAVDSRVSRHDLVMLMEETPQELTGKLIYNTDLFESATMIEMLKSYEALLEAMVARPGCRVLDAPLHPEDEDYFAPSQNPQNKSIENLLKTEKFLF